MSTQTSKNKSSATLQDIRVRRRHRLFKTQHLQQPCRSPTTQPSNPILTPNRPKLPLPFPLQSLKASNYAKRYHIADTPEMIFRVSELLEEDPQALQLEESKLSQARTLHESRSHKLTYLHKSYLRKETEVIQRDLVGNLEAVDRMPNLFVTDQIEYKQQILNGYFDVVLRDVKRECVERGKLLQGIWNITSGIFSQISKLLAQKIAVGQVQHLNEFRSTHSQYQTLIATYVKQHKRLTQLAKQKQDFIDNLVFNLRYRRRQIRKLYGAVKFASNCLNEYRRMYLDLEKEHIELQMQVKDISREMAVFLIERRKHIMREKEKAIKVFQPRKKVRQAISKEMEAQNPDTRKHSDEMYEGFIATKQQKGPKHIIIDDQLETVYGRLNVELFENDFAGDADYGYVDKGTCTNDFIFAGKDFSGQITKADKMLEGLVKDRGLQTSFYIAPTFKDMRDFGMQTMRKQLDRVGKLSEVKIMSYTTRISQLMDDDGKSSNRSSIKSKKGQRKSSQKGMKSRFSGSNRNSFEAFEKIKNKNFVNTVSTNKPEEKSEHYRYSSFQKPPQHITYHTRQTSQNFETQASQQLEKISESQQNLYTPQNYSIYQEAKRFPPSKPSKYHEIQSSRNQSSHFSTSSNDTFVEIKRQHLKKAEDAKRHELMSKYFKKDSISSSNSAGHHTMFHKSDSSSPIDQIIQVFLNSINRGNLSQQDMQKLRLQIQTSITKGQKIMDLLLTPCKNNKLGKIKFTKKMSADLKMRRLFAIYQSAHMKILEGSKSDLTELIYDWFRESRLPNTELQMKQFLADIFEERNNNITFETLALMTGVLPNSPFAPLISQADVSMYLSLLFTLNCSPEHSFAKGYTTLEKLSERLEKVLTDFMGDNEAKVIAKCLYTQIETNKARLQIPQTKSSNKLIKINLQRAIQQIMNKILQIKEVYYRDTTQLVKLVSQSSSQSFQDIIISFETFKFFARCTWPHKADYILFMSRFLESANCQKDYRYMRVERFASFCLRYGIPTLKTTSQKIAAELEERPDIDQYFGNQEGWAIQKSYIEKQLTLYQKYNAPQKVILNRLSQNFNNTEKKNMLYCRRAYDLLEWQIFNGQAQQLTQLIMGDRIQSLYTSSILIKKP